MKLKEDILQNCWGLENGTPSHDCLSDLFSSIDFRCVIVCKYFNPNELGHSEKNKIMKTARIKSYRNNFFFFFLPEY